MLFIQMFIKTLLMTKFCQSLTIYEPRQRKSNIKEYPTFGALNSTTISEVMPYQQPSTLSEATLLSVPQPGYIPIYPEQYLYNNRRTAAHPKSIIKTNEQPAVNASIESEMVHDMKTNEDKARNQQHQQLSFVNYNNAIYHINTVKRASPWANNEQKEMCKKFLVRKQRNSNENHDDTNKLIEQNIEKRVNKNANEVYDQQFTTATSSVATKQPSASSTGPTTKTSHEIRYLHDIFLNYPKSHQVNFGHIQLSPALFEKRFQSQKLGNRYKGEILWLDNTGGFAQHYWDLALGRL